MAQFSDTFTFSRATLDKARGSARFYFDLQTKRRSFHFTETLRFPAEGIQWENIPSNLLENILGDLSLAFGMSYWKISCPKKIEVAFGNIGKVQAAFWNAVYTKGFGEFFYKNKIDFRGLVKFPYGLTPFPPRLPRSARNDGVLQNRSLLQLGGGKDSLVSAELLKQARKPFALFMLNTSLLQQRVARRVGMESIVLTRTLDPQLLELNKNPATFNGHVPISVLYAFSGLFAAILYDYRFVIASNEASANYGNVRYKGEEINHQWSKSLEFEDIFRSYTRHFITPDITYFSLLRPLDEITVARLFARYKKYLSVFSSCNENFKTTRSIILGRAKNPGGKRWCGRCPKCAFVFACLAAYLPKKEVVRIFGKNLFSDDRLTPLFRELLGLKNFKPFECVGTPEETRRALLIARERAEYRDDAAMKMFEEIVGKEDVRVEIKKPRQARSDTLPEEFRSLISGFASAHET